MRLLEQDPDFRKAVFGNARQMDTVPTLVDVTSAADWFWAESPQDFWDLAEDMHALTLPSAVTYMEYITPGTIKVGNTITSSGDLKGISVGCLAMIVEIAKEERSRLLENFVLERFLIKKFSQVGDNPVLTEKAFADLVQETGWQKQRETGLANGIAPRFLLNAVLAIDSKRGYVAPMLSVSLYLDENGKAYPGEQGTQLLNLLVPGMTEAQNPQSMFMPFAFALSLMNCRNVTLIDDQRSLNRNQRRRMARENHPIIDYKWLHIKQLHKEIDADKEHPQTGRHNRLHFVRAHWAHYTADAPLFGKYKGTFWRPQHVKGKLSEGIILKDYKVDS